jgi:hypothetical protein
MAKMISNANPKKNPWTTIIGIICLVLGLGYIVGPSIGIKVTMDEWKVYCFFISGAGLLIMPDDITSIFKKVIQTKSKNI